MIIENKKLSYDIEHISNLCQPLVEYLKLNGTPYTEIHISMNEVKITSVELGIPCNKGSQSETNRL